jgi:hypothetical protein
MTDHFNVIPGEAWHVNFSPVEDDRIVHLCVGGTTIVLPALEAHKLGSALRAASGLDGESGFVESILSPVVLGPELATEVVLGNDDTIVICGIPYRISTLNLITEDGSLPSVVLHHVVEPQSSVRAAEQTGEE